jgi:ribosomal protein S18 acetylase RimI-like enzyme
MSSLVDSTMVRPMERTEVETLLGWAADEGWNPGLHDAEMFWLTDPEAFIAIELDGDLIGGGSIVKYDGGFGFMGLFIVNPEYRGKGLGTRLWYERKALLQKRLDRGATIGMDGVFEMVDWYRVGGFVFSHRQMRFEGKAGKARPGKRIVELGEIPFSQVLAYDTGCFPAPRERFLRAWISQPDSMALGAVDDGELAGFGVIRRCRDGAKIGPLFANDSKTAGQLLKALASFVAGETVYIDVPENNKAAVALARKQGLRGTFGTARMYLGPMPDVADERIYGVTTFELG